MNITSLARRFVALGGLLALLGSPAVSHAQLSQYNLPVESAILESHIDLQYQYSKLDFGLADVNVSLLSIEGQIKLGSFEVGVNVPFLVHGWSTTGNDTAFGDVMLGLKWRLFGVGDNLGVSLFANTYLPTHSGDTTRAYAKIQGGAVVSAQIIGLQVGGGVQTAWTIIGEGGGDTGLLGFYGYGRLPLLGLIAISAAIEYFNSLHPSGDLNAFLISPAVELSIAGAHVGVGARIAVTDDAQVITLGRAALIANAGFRF